MHTEYPLGGQNMELPAYVINKLFTAMKKDLKVRDLWQQE